MDSDIGIDIDTNIDVEQYLDNIVEQAEELPVKWVTTQTQLQQLVLELESCKTNNQPVALDYLFT